MNILDLSILLANFDKTGMSWSQGDFNGDGSVGLADLSNLLVNFDKTSGAVRPASVLCRSRPRSYCWPPDWSASWVARPLKSAG